jgi:Na+/H+ antiporter NhaD/arsenite permease-like protein
MWLTAIAILMVLFFIWDTFAYRKETTVDIKQDVKREVPLSITGKIKLIFLAGVILAVFFQFPALYRELVMALMIVLSLIFTKKELRSENKFTYGPIAEVAILFAGIFITMAPLLILLEVKGATLGIVRPWQYFWFAGGLSSFLDNAPTYLTFSSLAASVTKTIGHGGFPIVHGIGVRQDLLIAISAGSVFMGANTYIGNGPNFMVKSIAEEQGIKVPHFFGYMMYSGLILLPIFGLITLIFFV